MLTQITTTVQRPSITRWIPAPRDYRDVECALENAGVRYTDLYPTPRPNHWQVEVNGACADDIARKLNNINGFWQADGTQDVLNGEPLALVTFHFEYPPEDDPFFMADWMED